MENTSNHLLEKSVYRVSPGVTLTAQLKATQHCVTGLIVTTDCVTVIGF